MALSYLDKAIVFLLPLLVFQLFKDQKIYISIEYIYSITTVVIPLIDLGLSGYFFYAYRNSDDKEFTVNIFVKSFQRLYIIVCFIGLGLIALNYFSFEFESFIVFIVSRLLFVLATVFFASYYRLTNRPEKAVYITLASNIISLSFLFGYFFLSLEFSLWLIFIGQILFSIIYFFKCIIDVLLKNNTKSYQEQIKKIFLKALLFSWPSIMQVFIMMFITNFGKINVLTKMSLDDGVLLSLVQRFSMVIFLTHSSIWAFVLKDLYVEKNVLIIRRNLLYKYLAFLTLALSFVIFVTEIYLANNYNDLFRVSYISILIIGQTFLACVYAYLEVHYGRENKNIIKLYLALFSAFVFLFILIVLDMNFLEKISIAMFVSTFLSLLVSIFILYKRNYKIA
ncbi:hypothetical protein [Winogradskyella sp.]|uniref:hypothetical protein n=1 Tax=Winogradskyella sp. TaxID=1883156 RepID=UPI0025E28C7B|nr:hypothetical protein [Winogradskyella sp.]MCT4628550.1 hypothetical protein [Winogradskyella sp.]